MWTQTKMSCTVCGKNISNHKDRRVLFGDETRDVVVPTAVRLLRDCAAGRTLSETEALTILQAPTPGCSVSYICACPCFTKLKRLEKLEGEVEVLRSEIKEGMKVVHKSELRKKRDCDEQESANPPDSGEQVASSQAGNVRRPTSVLPVRKRLFFFPVVMGYHQLSL